jgi:GMP reductase
MRIEDSIKLDYSDVLMRPKRSTLISRRDVSLEREFTFRYSDITYKGIPIMAANMDTTGTFEMARALLKFNMFTCIHKHYDMDGWKEGIITDAGPCPAVKNIAISTGISTPDFIRTSDVLAAFDEVQYICVDVANGYTENFVRFIRKMRKAFPTKVIIAGNVVTADMTEALILAGADVVKVGIGPGSVCTTRKKTGVGYPQLSAVIECADAAHGLKGLIVADGGCTCPGDVAKAFAAGSDFVMLGGMLAGHAEGGGKIISETGDYPMVEFYGMSSETAQFIHGDGLTGYRASEGKRVLIPYKGEVENTVKDILGGVRSACTYTGSTQLKELSKRTTFIRVNNQLNNVYGTSSEG